MRRGATEEFRPFVNRYMKSLAKLWKIGVEMPPPVVAYHRPRDSRRSRPSRS